MALSNWDTIAFGPDGKSCEGSFTNPRNQAHIDIYKNWAYLRSLSKNPSVDYQYTGDTIAQIDHGEISIMGFRISAVRHDDQDAIFLHVEYTEDRGENTPDDQKRFIHHHFGGIGCYGFRDTAATVLAKLGRKVEDGEYWSSGSMVEGDNCKHYISCFKKGATPAEDKVEEIVYHDEAKDGPLDYADDWVGVKPETLEAFFKWLESREDRSWNKEYFAWIDACRASEKLRYNQGDAFFAANLNIKLPATEVGQSETPLMLKILKE